MFFMFLRKETLKTKGAFNLLAYSLFGDRFPFVLFSTILAFANSMLQKRPFPPVFAHFFTLAFG